MRAFAKGKPFMEVKAEGSEHPVFSESFLYDAVGKDDARFILGVVGEYDHLIRLIGEENVRSLLALRPGSALVVGIQPIGTEIRVEGTKKRHH